MGFTVCVANSHLRSFSRTDLNSTFQPSAGEHPAGRPRLSRAATVDVMHARVVPPPDSHPARAGRGARLRARRDGRERPRPGQLGRAWPRLRPRGGDERLRRLRLRPARQAGYKHILGHYYPGTRTRHGAEELAGRPRPPRHRLRRRRLQRRHRRLPGPRLDPTRTYQAHRLGGTVPPAQLRRQASPPTAARPCAPPAPATSTIGRLRHATAAPSRRWSTEGAAALNVVDALALDQYVKGVIPNESPPSWPMAELKAQAVISRSFALTGGVEGDGYDLYSDTRSQVYKGLESEYTTSDEAAGTDRRPGADVRRADRRDALLGLLGRQDGEHEERLRDRGPVPGRRPRSLRQPLPAARMDAEVQRAGTERKAVRDCSTGGWRKW